MDLVSLDANICIGLLKGDSGLVGRFRVLDKRRVIVCSIVRGELYFGARKSARVEDNLRAFREFLSPLGTLPFDDHAAEHYGSIRADLQRSGRPIGGNDLMIAAIARANDCVLATRNWREFERVTGLRVDPWADE